MMVGPHSNIAGFLDALKAGGIDLNKASIGVHKTNVIQNLQKVFGDKTDKRSLNMMQSLQTLNDIGEQDIGLNIIDPLITVAAKLEIFICLGGEEEKALMSEHKSSIKSSLFSLLTITEMVSDTRVKTYVFKAADQFIKDYGEKEGNKDQQA